MKSKINGWLRNIYTDKVDIPPRGEEDLHIPEKECACEPRLSQDTEGRLMIIHNSFDGREGFEQAEATPPASYRGRMAA